MDRQRRSKEGILVGSVDSFDSLTESCVIHTQARDIRDQRQGKAYKSIRWVIDTCRLPDSCNAPSNKEIWDPVWLTSWASLFSFLFTAGFARAGRRSRCVQRLCCSLTLTTYLDSQALGWIMDHQMEILTLEARYESLSKPCASGLVDL